jgi:hypothetical protein
MNAAIADAVMSDGKIPVVMVPPKNEQRWESQGRDSDGIITAAWMNLSKR